MRFHYKNARFHRVGGWLCIGTIFILGILFIVSAVQNFLALCHPDHILSYQGASTVSEISSLRNTNYRFTLENGDVIEVRESIHSTDFEVETNLKFRYTKHTRLFSKLHVGVSISTADDSSVILSEETTKNQRMIGAIGGCCLDVVCLLLALFPASLWLLLKRKPSKKY